ncbi:MAG: hypothetical protein ACLT38_09115 [Akkermansia sp.]
MVSDKTSDEVLLDVLNMLEEEAHVVPRIMISSELRSVTEDYAPGIKRYRNNINKMLPGRQHFELMSRTINSLIEDAAKQFNVLVIKTKTSLPYPIFILNWIPGTGIGIGNGTPQVSEAKDAATAARPRQSAGRAPGSGATPAPQGNKENPPMPGAPASPQTTCRSSAGKPPTGFPSGDRPPAASASHQDPLGRKTAIARFA